MHEPLARYAVRTPAWVWGGLAFAAVAIALLAWRALPLLGGHGVVTLGLFALIALLPALTVWSSAPYRVGGASIEVYADRVEVPRAWRGVQVFPLKSLRIARVRILQSVTVMDVPTGVKLDRGEVATFTADGLGSRRLSDRVFVEPGSLQFLLADLAAVSNGQPALGPVGWVALFDELEAVVREKRPADARDAQLEAQLDEELRR